MTNKKPLAFGLILGALVLVFGSMIGYQEYILTTGETVVLKTIPVDPRDIFRGEYVILGYEIQDQVEEMMKSDFYIDGKKKAYVSLDTSQSPAVATGVSMDRPESGLYIAGEVTYDWNNHQTIDFPSLSQYYVPEGQGRALERIPRDELMVEVSISKHGAARIVNLLDKEGQVIDVSALQN